MSWVLRRKQNSCLPALKQCGKTIMQARVELLFRFYCSDGTRGLLWAAVASVTLQALHCRLLAKVCQQITAYNVSNLNTGGFKASKATFQENSGGGVSATVTSTQDSVDISREAVNLLSNAEGFKANVNVQKTEDEMSKVLFSIKAWGSSENTEIQITQNAPNCWKQYSVQDMHHCWISNFDNDKLRVHRITFDEERLSSVFSLILPFDATRLIRTGFRFTVRP